MVKDDRVLFYSIARWVVIFASVVICTLIAYRAGQQSTVDNLFNYCYNYGGVLFNGTDHAVLCSKIDLSSEEVRKLLAKSA